MRRAVLLVGALILIAFGCGDDEPDSPWLAPGTPRLVYPSPGTSESGSTVLLRWSAPSAAPVHVQLCADRACASVLAERNEAGSSTTFARDGRKGIVFWRILQNGDSSPTWTFNWGATGFGLGLGSDIDGDGYPDLCGKSLDRDYAGVYYPGGPEGLSDGVPFCDLHHYATVTEWCFSAGDINGDGYADTYWEHVGPRNNVAYTLCYGGPRGVVNEPVDTALWPVGDVNGDGYADMAGARDSRSATFPIFFGPDLGTRRQDVPAPAETCGVYNVGDINGDGFADVAAKQCFGTPGLATYKLSVFRGTPDGLVSAGTIPVGASAVGDLNGDGMSDFFFHCTRPGCDGFDSSTGYVAFWGSADGSPRAQDIDLAIPDNFLGHVPPWRGDPGSFIPCGDFDGDGYADLATFC